MTGPTLPDEAAARVMARCDELARCSAVPDGIERVYLSPEHARVNRVVAGWMAQVGLRTWTDAAGNLCGHLDGADPEAPSLVLGSHLDTVRDAGRYDGVLGVLMAIEAVGRLAPRAATLPFGLDVIAFWDEEGTRFGTALLGSSAVGGRWDPAWWDLADPAGVTLRDAFVGFGLDPARIGEAARPAAAWAGYLEAHIEQGPLLDRDRRPLAVVSSIAAARRATVTVHGRSGHGGTTPYDARHDALLGAAEAALAVERVCRAGHHLVGTVGRLEVFPGAVNVVPGEARFTVDLRSEADGSRDRAWQAVSRELDEIAGRRGLTWTARTLHEASAVTCDPLLADVLGAGADAAGGREAPRLYSPAGHDGMALDGVTGVGMLFLRNPDGISHHPQESVGVPDVTLGIEAMVAAVDHLSHERR